MKKILRSIFKKTNSIRNNIFAPDWQFRDKLMNLQGVNAAYQVRSIERIETLSDIEFSVSSQWGEDGIIEWLVYHNGDMPETFVEFGVESYREANTRFLLTQRNWKGLVIDGSRPNIEFIKEDAVSWRHDLTSVCAFITAENINSIVEDAGFRDEIGILSIDIDGNDYWVWKAINIVKPHFVVAEYNSVLGDARPLSVPYDPSFSRTAAHHSNLYYGASISALYHLADARGYAVLGSNRAGNNVFFVRHDRLHKFEDRIRNRSPRPSRFREGREPNYAMSFVRGVDRATVIQNCIAEDVTTSERRPLKDFMPIYSDMWLRAIENGDRVQSKNQ